MASTAQSASALEYVKDARTHLERELKNHSVIVKNLYQEGVLRDEEVSMIEKETLSNDKTRKILDYVIRKGEDACYALLRSIDMNVKQTLESPMSGGSTQTNTFDLHRWISCFSFKEEDKRTGKIYKPRTTRTEKRAAFQSPKVWSIDLSKRKASILLEELKLQSEKKQVELRGFSDEQSEVRSFLQCLPYISQLRLELHCSDKGIKFLVNLFCAAAEREEQTGEKILELLSSVCSYQTFPFMYHYVDYQCDLLLDLYSQLKDYETKTGRRVLPALQSVFQSPTVWSIDPSKRKASILLEVLKLQSEKKQVELRGCSDEESEVRSFLQCLPYISQLRLEPYCSDKGIKFLVNLFCAAAEREEQTGEKILELLSSVCSYKTFPLMYHDVGYQCDLLLDLYSQLKDYETKTGRRVLPALQSVFQSPTYWSIDLSKRKASILLEVLKLQPEKKQVKLRGCSDEESEVRSFLQCLPYISQLSVDRNLLLRFIHCCAASEAQQGAASDLLRTLQHTLDLSCSSLMYRLKKIQTKILSLSTDDCRAIVTILRHSTTDTQLDLRDCEVGDSGLDLLFPVFDRVRLRASNAVLLQLVSLVPVSSEGDTVRRGMCLLRALGEELDLSHTTLDQRSCRGLALILDFTDGLRKLDLSHCQVTDELLLTLITHLHKVQVLDLSNNKITDAMTSELLKLVSINPSIHTVRLFNNNIVDTTRFMEDKRFQMRVQGNLPGVVVYGQKWTIPWLTGHSGGLHDSEEFTSPYIKMKRRRRRVKQESEFPESTHTLSYFSDEAGPSNIKTEKKQIPATPHTVKYETEEPDFYSPFNLSADPSTSSTMDVSEDNREDQLCPDDPDRTHVPPEAVTPELLTEQGNTSYRFSCPGPGMFRCTLTGVVFVVTQEAELQYKTVLWDERLLQTAGKMAAGPLFNIQCHNGAVSQLHLPHCEIMDAPLPEGLLSVAHITPDGMSILEPLKITDDYVVVNIPHLSGFGLVWDYIKRLLRISKPISGHVLLFLRPPNIKKQTQTLDVLLLPKNIELNEVIKQQDDATKIKVPSYCELICDGSYNVACPEASLIQPKKGKFVVDFGKVFSPTFTVRLSTGGGRVSLPEELTVKVQDRRNQVVWEQKVYLTDLRSEDLQGNLQARGIIPAEERLRLVQEEFVQRVSEPVLNQLLDTLLGQGVINDGEMEAARSSTPKANKAREVISMVRGKGTEASLVLITAILKKDKHLFKVLGLS